MNSNNFCIQKIVTQEDLDNLNHVNNVVYLKWMEEIAIEHWDYLSKDFDFSNFIWVVVRHEVDYLRQAKLGDEITIKTWVGESKGFKSERFIEFSSNKKVLVKSLTYWGLLDAKTHKPKRISENILNVLEAVK